MYHLGTTLSCDLHVNRNNGCPTDRRMLQLRGMLSIILLSLLGLASAEHNGVLPEQPNILFLMCDSMDGRVLDPTSPVSDRLEMPHLRALASTGVNFLNTYAASPQCVPSRAAMFTGRRTDQTQALLSEEEATDQHSEQKRLGRSRVEHNGLKCSCVLSPSLGRLAASKRSFKKPLFATLRIVRIVRR